MATIWNNSDKSGSNVSLTNGNLTATITSSDNAGIRSTTSHGAGKWYAEFSSIVAHAVGDPTAVGLANASYTLTNGPDTSNTQAAFIQNGPVVTVGNAAKSTGGLGANIDGANVVGVCWDADNQLVWFTTDGTNWNNGGTASPVAGIGGYSTASGTPLGTAYLCVYLRWALSGTPYDTATLNAGASAFVYTVPSGFKSWDPPASNKSQVLHVF